MGGNTVAMAVDSSTLGWCPYCLRPVAERDVTIRYEPAAGDPVVVAECPSCRELVNPC